MFKRFLALAAGLAWTLMATAASAQGNLTAENKEQLPASYNKDLSDVNWLESLKSQTISWDSDEAKVLQYKLIAIGCLDGDLGQYGATSAARFTKFRAFLAQTKKVGVLAIYTPNETKLEQVLSLFNGWLADPPNTKPTLKGPCTPKVDSGSLAKCDLPTAGTAWLKASDAQWVKDHKDVPGLGRLRAALVAVGDNSATLLPKPPAPVAWKNTTLDAELELLTAALATAREKLDIVASIMAVGNDAACGKCRLLQAFTALRTFANKASTPDKLASDGSKPPEIRFDEIDFKMVNTSYESIMLWNTLWSKYEGGINQLPPKVDVNLYTDAMSLLRDIINKFNTLKGSTKVPKSDSPLTYEAGYGVACIDFVPSKPK